MKWLWLWIVRDPEHPGVTGHGVCFAYNFLKKQLSKEGPTLTNGNLLTEWPCQSIVGEALGDLDNAKKPDSQWDFVTDVSLRM